MVVTLRRSRLRTGEGVLWLVGVVSALVWVGLMDFLWRLGVFTGEREVVRALGGGGLWCWSCSGLRWFRRLRAATPTNAAGSEARASWAE